MAQEGQSLPPSILCVDSDPEFCKYVAQLAIGIGATCEIALSIEDAKQKIEENLLYSVFVIEETFVDGSGFELIAWIREKKRMDIPVIFLSLVQQDAISFRILKESLRVDYVLEKSVPPKEIVNLLSELCSINYQLGQKSLSEHALPDIKASYQKSIFDKVERLENLIRRVKKNPNQKNFQDLRTEIHKLAGSSGSYGYVNVSSLCKELEVDLTHQMELIKEASFDLNWLNVLDHFFTDLKLHFQIVPPIQSTTNFLVQESIKNSSNYEILVIDDDIDTVQYVSEALKDLGMEVKQLSSGLLLHESLVDHHPDLILIDADLSDEKKTEVFHSLIKIPHTCLVVAMVTITQESNLIRKIYGSEVDDILFKPLESSVLQKRLWGLLRKQVKKKEEL